MSVYEGYAFIQKLPDVKGWTLNSLISRSYFKNSQDLLDDEDNDTKIKDEW